MPWIFSPFSGTFDFYMAGGSLPPVETYNLLLESGDALLLENGDNIILENGV